MKKQALGILLILLAASGTFAQKSDSIQEPRPGFIISANFGGGISMMSLGFEKLFFIKPAFILAGKVALGFNSEFEISSSEPPNHTFLLPHHVSCNFGRNRSFLELGLGGAYMSNAFGNRYLVYPILGYRYHPFKDPGFSFRVWAYYPFGQGDLFDWDEIIFIPYGVSFGVAL
jgi:hypothetical protein